jgi:hypothetical protein
MELRCAKCGSEKIIPLVSIEDQGRYSDGTLRAVVGYSNPEAWVFKGTVYARLQASICGECGHTELTAQDPAALYAAYLKTDAGNPRELPEGKVRTCEGHPAATAQSTEIGGMTESLGRPPQATLLQKLVGGGCGVLLLLAITTNLGMFRDLPEVVGRALTFVVDALTSMLFFWLLGLLLYLGLRKDSKVNVGGYGFTLLVGLVAFVMIWNLVALYSQVGLQPIIPFGWEPVARPGNIGLMFLVGFLVLGRVTAGVQKVRRQPTP